LIVYLRLQNPNTYDVTLRRDWFILVDYNKDYFLPSTTGTQTELIKLPANGVLDREMLSFMVPDNAFAGRVALFVGQNYMVLVKNERPFEAHPAPAPVNVYIPGWSRNGSAPHRRPPEAGPDSRLGCNKPRRPAGPISLPFVRNACYVLSP